MCMRELSNFKQKIWVKSDLIIHFSTFDCNVISMEACLQHSFVLAGLAACQPLRINKALYESEPSMYTRSMLALSIPYNSCGAYRNDSKKTCWFKVNECHLPYEVHVHVALTRQEERGP